MTKKLAFVVSNLSKLKRFQTGFETHNIAFTDRDNSPALFGSYG